MDRIDDDNRIFHLAARMLKETNRNIFLTGKAGTGKTSFLKHIQKAGAKRSIVTAPTGVAAINAGGVTLHSFFQLPFGAFLPAGIQREEANFSYYDPHTLLRKLKLSAARKELMRELELLIIDEVSMLRADVLDAIDLILRHVRKKYDHPFGDVQVLFIGDLFQLPPVVSDTEWNILGKHYASPFFFSAKVLQNNPPVNIELEKVYRQKEQSFIDILNRIRSNTLQPSDLEELNKRFDPQASTIISDTITLTSHNRQARTINEKALNDLPGKLYRFQANIEGEFNENAWPADNELQLKQDALVMFIRNDSGESRRFYNGKLAKISTISDSSIRVKPLGEEIEFDVEKESWKNLRYTLNKEKNSIEEEELGSFTQYPIRLAWAITIHKSQGLSFEKIRIDAGLSFASGQVYVALSRCQTLEGITLLSKIPPSAVQISQEIAQFAGNKQDPDKLQDMVAQEKSRSDKNRLLQTFQWQPILLELEPYLERFKNHNFQPEDPLTILAFGLENELYQQRAVADKFISQLQSLIEADNQDSFIKLKERVAQAIRWFERAILENLIKPIQKEKGKCGKTKQDKKIAALLLQMEEICYRRIKLLQTATYKDQPLCTEPLPSAIASENTSSKRSQSIKPQKGDSMLQTLELFKAGMDIAGIASKRGFSKGTIETHLAELVLAGNIKISDLLSDERQAIITEAIHFAGMEKLNPIKEKLGDDFSYAEIRMVINHLKSLQSQHA